VLELHLGQARERDGHLVAELREAIAELVRQLAELGVRLRDRESGSR